MTIPSGVTEIGKKALYSCSSLQNLTLPASLKIIGNSCFDYAKAIQNVYYGGTENDFSKVIWESSTNLTNRTWHYSYSGAGSTNAPVSKYDTLLNYPTTLEKDFTVANGVLTKYNGSDTIVVIPSTINGQTITKIGDSAFSNKSDMLALYIPNTVTELGIKSLYSCSSLQEISLPASIRVIGNSAFDYTKVIKNVYYGGTEATFAQVIWTSSTNLTSRTWHYNESSSGSQNPVVSKLSTLLTTPVSSEANFTFANGTITKYNGSESIVVIPSTINGQTVTKIGDSAFSNKSNMLGLYIPNTVTELGTKSLYSCSSLYDLALFSSVKVIGNSCFDYTKSIGRIYYNGTETDRNAILMTATNNFTNPTWHYNTNLSLLSAPVITVPTTPTIPEVVVPEITVPEPTAPSSGTGDVNVYVDVTVNNWYFSYVDFVVSNNIMSGTGTSFQPDVSANRGTIADALANLSKESLTAVLPETYTDVKGSGFENAIAWCMANGVMGGYDSTTFGTLDNLTREQFAVSLRAFAQKMGKYQEPTQESINSLAQFSDSGEISSWARSDMAWAVENGLMAGSNGALLPQGNVTRAQVAVMISGYNDTFG